MKDKTEGRGGRWKTGLKDDSRAFGQSHWREKEKPHTGMGKGWEEHGARNWSSVLAPLNLRCLLDAKWGCKGDFERSGTGEITHRSANSCGRHKLAGSVCIEAEPWALWSPLGAPPGPHQGLQPQPASLWCFRDPETIPGAVRRFPGAFKGTLLQRTSERLTKKVVGSASHLCRLDGGVQTQLVRQLSCPPTSGYFPLPSLGPFTSRVPEGWWLLYYFCQGARRPAQPAVISWKLGKNI